MGTKLLIFALVCFALPLAAQDNNAQKDRLLEQAAIAERSGKLEAAETAYCALTKLDTQYAPQCKLYGDAAEKERQHDLKRLEDAKAAVTEHNFERARQIFHSVKTDRAATEAQDWLDSRLPAAERDWIETQARLLRQQQIDDSLARARAAIARRDFISARDLLNGIDTPDSRTLLSQIDEQQQAARVQDQYEQLVRGGDDSAGRGRLAEALVSYKKAAAMTPATDELRKKIEDAEARLRKALNGSISGDVLDAQRHGIAGVTIAIDGGSGTPKRTIYSNEDGSFALTGVAPGTYLVSASKSGRELANSRIAVSAGEDVEITLSGGGASFSGEASDSSSLIRAIGTFYRGSPDDLRHAEWMLENYVGTGRKLALSQFYLGATRLSLYYLAGAKPDNKDLYRQALDAFRRAKTVPEFQPPAEISPRITQVYEETK